MDDRMEGVRRNVRDELDIVLARLVLGALDERATRTGSAPSRGDLIRTLLRKPRFLESTPAASLEGMLQRFRQDDLRSMIEVLEERGLVRTGRGEGREVELTAEGLHFLKAFRTAPVGLVDRVLDRPEERTELYSALKLMRLAHARVANLPSYRILHDRTMRAIVARRPRSADELRAVPGIGEVTARRFGVDILDCVARHAPVPPEPTALPEPPAPPPPGSAAAPSVGETGLVGAATIRDAECTWRRARSEYGAMAYGAVPSG
jgi:hypothetical protein